MSISVGKFAENTLNGITYNTPVVFNKKLKTMVTLEWCTEDKTYYTPYGVSVFDYFKAKLEEGFELRDFEIFYLFGETEECSES